MRNTLFLLLGSLFFSATHAQQTVNYFDTLSVGGIKQVISVNGKKDGPVLLFLHGGPGESRIPQMEKVSGLLRQQFCVVMWDQRETGSTLKLNASPVPLTLSLINQDTYELVQQLRKKLHQDKVYIMGESWGTLLGFHLAAAHPECVKALLMVCPVYFFLGGKDIQANAGISKVYFNELKAPRKKLYWLENDGHLLMLTAADSIQQTILHEILPAR